MRECKTLLAMRRSDGIDDFLRSRATGALAYEHAVYGHVFVPGLLLLVVYSSIQAVAISWKR
jgi:hypothetical protein